MLMMEAIDLRPFHMIKLADMTYLCTLCFGKIEREYKRKDF